MLPGLARICPPLFKAKRGCPNRREQRGRWILRLVTVESILKLLAVIRTLEVNLPVRGADGTYGRSWIVSVCSEFTLAQFDMRNDVNYDMFSQING